MRPMCSLKALMIAKCFLLASLVLVVYTIGVLSSSTLSSDESDMKRSSYKGWRLYDDAPYAPNEDDITSLRQALGKLLGLHQQRAEEGGITLLKTSFNSVLELSFLVDTEVAQSFEYFKNPPIHKVPIKENLFLHIINAVLVEFETKILSRLSLNLGEGTKRNGEVLRIKTLSVCHLFDFIVHHKKDLRSLRGPLKPSLVLKEGVLLNSYHDDVTGTFTTILRAIREIVGTEEKFSLQILNDELEGHFNTNYINPLVAKLKTVEARVRQGGHDYLVPAYKKAFKCLSKSFLKRHGINEIKKDAYIFKNPRDSEKYRKPEIRLLYGYITLIEIDRYEQWIRYLGFDKDSIALSFYNNLCIRLCVLIYDCKLERDFNLLTSQVLKVAPYELNEEDVESTRRKLVAFWEESQAALKKNKLGYPEIDEDSSSETELSDDTQKDKDASDDDYNPFYSKPIPENLMEIYSLDISGNPVVSKSKDSTGQTSTTRSNLSFGSSTVDSFKLPSIDHQSKKVPDTLTGAGATPCKPISQKSPDVIVPGSIAKKIPEDTRVPLGKQKDAGVPLDRQKDAVSSLRRDPSDPVSSTSTSLSSPLKESAKVDLEALKDSSSDVNLASTRVKSISFEASSIPISSTPKQQPPPIQITKTPQPLSPTVSKDQSFMDSDKSILIKSATLSSLTKEQNPPPLTRTQSTPCKTKNSISSGDKVLYDRSLLKGTTKRRKLKPSPSIESVEISKEKSQTNKSTEKDESTEKSDSRKKDKSIERSDSRKKDGSIERNDSSRKDESTAKKEDEDYILARKDKEISIHFVLVVVYFFIPACLIFGYRSQIISAIKSYPLFIIPIAIFLFDIFV